MLENNGSGKDCNSTSINVHKKKKRRSLYLCFFLLLVVLCMYGLLTPSDPWPPIEDKEALVKACSEWLYACKQARERQEKDPPQPAEVERLIMDPDYLPLSYARDNKVMIPCKRLLKKGERGVLLETELEYIVMPDNSKNSMQTPNCWPCLSTNDPRIFKSWTTWGPYEDSGGKDLYTEENEYPYFKEKIKIFIFNIFNKIIGFFPCSPPAS